MTWVCVPTFGPTPLQFLQVFIITTIFLVGFLGIAAAFRMVLLRRWRSR